jgi:hypothetical protein
METMAKERDGLEIEGNYCRVLIPRTFLQYVSTSRLSQQPPRLVAPPK